MRKIYDFAIDNYDSFTYNLYQYIGTFNDDIKVVRNDKITIEEIEKMIRKESLSLQDLRAQKKPEYVLM